MFNFRKPKRPVLIIPHNTVDRFNHQEVTTKCLFKYARDLEKYTEDMDRTMKNFTAAYTFACTVICVTVLAVTFTLLSNPM